MSIADKTTALLAAIDAYDDVKVSTAKSLVKELKYKVAATQNASGTVTLDLSEATEFPITVTGNTTFAFTEKPASGQTRTSWLRLTNAGSYTLAFPTGTRVSGGTWPEFTAGGVDVIGVKYDPTADAYMIFEAGPDMKPGA